MKKYVRFENLNEYERENNRISYKRLVERFFDSMILCNKMGERYEHLEVVAGTDYDEENDYYYDIYQYYIVDGCFDEDILAKVGDELGVVYYDDELEVYVLGVQHFGTSWGYVLTDIKPTEDLDEADI